jgi:hypothetical protein
MHADFQDDTCSPKSPSKRVSECCGANAINEVYKVPTRIRYQHYRLDKTRDRCEYLIGGHQLATFCGHNVNGAIANIAHGCSVFGHFFGKVYSWGFQESVVVSDAHNRVVLRSHSMRTPQHVPLSNVHTNTVPALQPKSTNAESRVRLIQSAYHHLNGRHHVVRSTGELLLNAEFDFVATVLDRFSPCSVERVL